MKRFLVFPLVMGICGVFFLTYCFAQFAVVVMTAVAITNPRLSTMPDLFLEQLSTVFLSSYLRGATLGIIAGLGLAIWNKVRNGSVDKKLMLIPNIFWCLFYVLLFSIPNHIIGLSYLYGYTTIKFFGVLPLVGLLLLNFTAIFWAAIRSATTDDVLTPRVLRDKLRERSRLN